MRKLKLFTITVFVLASVLFGYRTAFAGSTPRTLNCLLDDDGPDKIVRLNFTPQGERVVVLIRMVAAQTPFGQLHLQEKALRPLLTGKMAEMAPVELTDLQTGALVRIQLAPNSSLSQPRLQIVVTAGGGLKYVFRSCNYDTSQGR